MNNWWKYLEQNQNDGVSYYLVSIFLFLFSIKFSPTVTALAGYNVG